MAGYSRVLRVVVNGLALVSLLLTSLPLSQVVAAPVPADSAPTGPTSSWRWRSAVSRLPRSVIAAGGR